MTSQERRTAALAAADAYFARLEADPAFPPVVRSAVTESGRAPMLAIVYADGYLAGQDRERERAARLLDRIDRVLTDAGLTGGTIVQRIKRLIEGE